MTARKTCCRGADTGNCSASSAAAEAAARAINTGVFIPTNGGGEPTDATSLRVHVQLSMMLQKFTFYLAAYNLQIEVQSFESCASCNYGCRTMPHFCKTRRVLPAVHHKAAAFQLKHLAL